MVIRIASSLNYNESSFTSNVYDIEQFAGTVERFLITQPEFVASANYSYLENYRTPRYEFQYDSVESRFKLRTYGSGEFDVHSMTISESLDDSTQIIGANIVKIGYPDIQSSSQVFFYATLIDYDGTVIEPRTRLSQNNYLGFLNNTNLFNKYIKFEFEIFGDDITYYPPRIKSFQMQTFKSKNNSAIIRDSSGPDYTLYPTSSSIVYLPEIRYTPTAYITDISGLKLNKTIVDFTENIMPKPLDPRTIEGLKLWLDARFINGLGKENPDDDSRVSSWSDLSDNFNNAIGAPAPIFRTQSLNNLRMNQLNGADTDNLSFIIAENSGIEASAEGSVSGDRGIKVTPNGSSTNSYIDVSFNSASIGTFANQTYTVVGSIKLTKPQTASALHQNARKIIINNVNGGVENFTASSMAATNTRGVYSLSAVFTTSASTTRSIIRFYNGSYDSADPVYWDNLGVYPVTSGSYVSQWIEPLTLNDFPTIKFDGSTTFMQSSASITAPNSLYIVARNFGDSILLQSTTASILYSNSASYFVSYGSAQNYSLSDNKFKLFSILNNGTSASVFINGNFVSTKNTGSLSIDKLFIGRQLRGDISAVILYKGINSIKDRERIERWLNESFPMY